MALEKQPDPYYWHYRCDATGLLTRLPFVIPDAKAKEIEEQQIQPPPFPCSFAAANTSVFYRNHHLNHKPQQAFHEGSFVKRLKNGMSSPRLFREVRHAAYRSENPVFQSPDYSYSHLHVSVRSTVMVPTVDGERGRSHDR